MAAVAPSTPPILPMGLAFPVKGIQLVFFYLQENALRGKLSNAIIPGGSFVAAGLNIFSVRPNKLPFVPSHRTQHGTIWGYFSAEKPTHDIQQAVGGYWVRYGPEKRHSTGKGKVICLERRFVFKVKQQGANRRVTWVDTPWHMKEYRLDTSYYQSWLPNYPNANLDFVIRKVFTKLAVMAPPPPPIPSREALQQAGSRLPPRKARPPKVRESTTKPVDPPPLPARSRKEASPMDPPPLPTRSCDKARPMNPPPLPARSGEKAGPMDHPLPPPPDYSIVMENPGSSDDRHFNSYVLKNYLDRKCRTGKLRGGAIIKTCYIPGDKNILVVNPDDLPYHPSEKGDERCGYFFMDQPASDDQVAASCGRWVRDGHMKWYDNFVVFRRRFVFHAEWRDGDGQVRRDRTRWVLKEYQVDKKYKAFLRIKRAPEVNLDCVMYKVFQKPVDPPPPAQSSEERPGSNNNSSDEAGPSSTNNPVIVDDEAGSTSLHDAKHDRPKASNNLVVPPPPLIHSSEKENPRGDEDRVKKCRLNNDNAVFTRAQPNPILVRPPMLFDRELSLGPPCSNSNNPDIVDGGDNDAEPPALHHATTDHSEASKNLVGCSALVHPPSPVRSNGEDNSDFTFPVLDEDQMKEHCLIKDDAIFPWGRQPNPKVVADMESVVRPPSPVRSSGKDNPDPMVEEHQMNEQCLAKDDVIFPCVQPNPKLVADMGVVRPSSPRRLELKLWPSPDVRSSEKDVFPRGQPTNMDSVIRPSPTSLNLEQRLEPPLDLELRLGPTGSY